MEPSLKKAISVLIISTSYPQNAQDWRGRFIWDMLSALSRRRDILLRTWMPTGDIPPEVISAALPQHARFLDNITSSGGIAHILRKKGVFALPYVLTLMRYLRDVYKKETQVDVFHVNWLQNLLPLWGTTSPAVVTVLGTDYKMLKLPGMITALRAVLKQRKSFIAPNAHWMENYLEKKFGDIARVCTVPFGVQDRWFDIDRKFVCKGVNNWITVSRLTANKIGPLFDWGKSVFHGQNRLILMGPNQDNIQIPGWLEYKGPTYPDELAQTWFPTAAGLITLSRHDEGRPQVILEAMAAGVPVIVSDLPAHKDIIRHGKTGFIVSSLNELEQAVKFMSIPENNLSISNNAKQWVRKHIGTWDDAARRYKDVYIELIGKK